MSWRQVTLGELCDAPGASIQTGPFGSQLHAEEYSVTGVPVVMPQDLGENYVTDERIARIPPEVADRLGRHRLCVGDIVYSRRGDVEKRALITFDEDGWICGTGCLRVRLADRRPAHYKFVSYALGNPDVRSWIRNHAVGATMPNLNTSILAAVPIRLPDPAVQEAIAVVLEALEDKIAANRHLVEQVDSLAKMHFETLPLEATVRLTQTGRFVNGKAFTKDASGTGRMVARIAELNSGPGVSTVYNDIDVEDDYLARPGDLLFSWSGSLMMRRWFHPEAIVNQHIFKVIPNPGFPKWLVAQLISRQLEHFRAIAADKTTTMGHIQRRHLDEPVDVPSSADIAKYDPLMTALWERALAAEQESLTLAALRDALLPALMSGRLSVRDAEAAVSEVV